MEFVDGVEDVTCFGQAVEGIAKREEYTYVSARKRNAFAYSSLPHFLSVDIGPQTSRQVGDVNSLLSRRRVNDVLNDLALHRG